MYLLAKKIINWATPLSFVIGGIVVNLLQIVIYLLVKPFNKPLFRTINHYLQYSTWSQTVAVADWGYNVSLRVWLADEESHRDFGSNSGLVIMNHRYDLDWLTAWMYADKIGTLGGDKAMVKASLRYIPVIGWGWAISDMIFLHRDWKKDKESLRKTMDEILQHPRSLILSFLEGTRFTKTKYENSVKFAKEKNLPILKHHLLPRTRGFNSMMTHVLEAKAKNKDLKFDVFSMQVAFREEETDKASLPSVLNGEKVTIYVYVKKLSLDNIDPSDENSLSNYLYNVYKDKDELMEYFRKHGVFPGIEKPYKRRLATLLNWITWLVLTYTSLFYGLFKVFSSGNTILMVCVATFILAAVAGVVTLINSTKVSKSSSYGVVEKKSQ